MTRISHFSTAAIALATLAAASLATAPANAAVICKTAGVPKGCIAATAPVIVAPAAPAATTTVTHAAYVAPAPVATTTVARAAYIAPPAAVTHAGYTRVTPYGVRHVGTTRVWR